MKLTEILAGFLYYTELKNIPNTIIDIAQEHILDCIGVTIAGSDDPSGKIITNFVKEMGGEPKVSVIRGGFKTSALQAALANGTMAHALDYDDDYSDFTVAHPSAVVLPAALAIGEENAVSGLDILEAYILGIEAELTIGSISNMVDINRGWHGTSTLGTLGAAAACSKILKLDIEQIKIAMGIAASCSSGLRQNFGTMTKPFHAGSAAANGVMAAMLAERGFTASKEIFEGSFGFLNLFSNKEKWGLREGIINELGNPFKIQFPGIYIKQYPSCAGTHSAIDGILNLVGKYKINPDDIKDITCLVHPLNVSMLSYANPKTSFEGKFSMHFCLAIALLDKEVGLEQFTDEKVLHSKTQDLIKKIHMDVNPALKGKDYKPGAILKVSLNNGHGHSNEVDTPEGSPKNRLTIEKLNAKYEKCCKLLLSDKEINKIKKIIMNLSNIQNIEKLLDSIR